MRAFAVRNFGEAPSIHDLPIPPAKDAFLIRIKFAGVNPIDYKLIDRLTSASKFPFVIGTDFAGVIEGVPAGERDFQVGDRVFGMARTHGSYAEHTAVPQGEQNEPLARIPDSVTDEQAAALPIPAVTALGALDLLAVAAGQCVLVMGATGGVGGYAVQMARSRGAHVLATVRGDSEEARRLGAEEVYDTNAGDVIAALHRPHPNGVDAVLDLVTGSDEIRRDAEILKSGARLVSTIAAADEKWFAQRQIKSFNITPNSNPAQSPQGLGNIARMLVDGTIAVRIRTSVGLEGAAAVLEKLRIGGLRGKAVIRLYATNAG